MAENDKGLTWNSTGAGELFTGSKAWVVGVKEGRLTLWEFSQPKLDIHLIQLCSISISPGVMWASCTFEYLEGDQKFTRTVDGIPNENARQMQLALGKATTSKLATFVAKNTPALDDWLHQTMSRLCPKPGVIVGDGEIINALSSVQSPDTPGGISWESILWHNQSEAAREKAKAWPRWDDSPQNELAERLRPHNEAAFKAALDRWLTSTTSSVSQGRWIPKGMASKLVGQCPAPEWPGRTWRQLVGEPSPEQTLRTLFEAANDKHLTQQQNTRKEFFDKVEKNPLTDEQIHACVCMDDSVLVVAAAGSGKTSTMVAKTGYVLHEGLATPDQILLLAFNRATANEVGERIAVQLRGVPNVNQVRSKTFHAFGIEVIGQATGKKPSLAPWVDPSMPGEDIRETAEIIRFLSARDSKFRRNWDLFRTIYARDIGKWGQHQEPDGYANGRRGFLTANGEIVKSNEERFIADWLYYNGVKYVYERSYEYETADEKHRQYFPDFYYPEIQLYHEHFALNAKGEAPKDFKGYLEGVEWKRKIHIEKGTNLIETTSHGLRTGESITILEQALIERGITPNFDPDRTPVGLSPVSERDLARSFRVFQQHVKNNGLSHEQLHNALVVQSNEGYGARLRMFLALYEHIADEWERRLKDGKFIDFEDMLVQAAENVESGRFKSSYTVILADEFQDSSRARIRLLKALAKNPAVQTHLCVVGDDWQGINRFAGSDISVMREFENTFENATHLTLNTTFRCPQEICDVSSAFIQANPAQIAKTVRTTNPLNKTPMLAYGLARKESIPSYVERQLTDMHRYACEGKLSPTKGSHITIMLMGRYRDDEPARLALWKKTFGDRLKIEYITAHGSKGLEAEYVFVLNVIQDIRGFPSRIQDDPALQLAMPAPDTFPFAEERRLFYVAMTRAKKQVRFYTTLSQPSQFLIELAKNHHLKIEPVDGEALEPCPSCGSGVLQSKNGPRGVFQGCSRFPACDFVSKAPRLHRVNARPAKNASRIRVPVKVGDQCPVCRSGFLQKKNGSNGAFLGCSGYPRCTATTSLTRSK